MEELRTVSNIESVVIGGKKYDVIDTANYNGMNYLYMISDNKNPICLKARIEDEVLKLQKLSSEEELKTVMKILLRN